MLTQGQFTLDIGDRALRGVFQAPAEPGRHGVVVISHGFKGFMEWGFFPCLSELLARRGFCAVRFNFSGSGMRPGDELVTDLEAFRNATFSQDVRELETVIRAIGDVIAPDHSDSDRIALLGHSRGGGISLLAAAERPSISALVTWAAVSTFDRLTEDERIRWRRDGDLPIVNARTGQELAIGIGVLDDLQARRRALDLERAARRLTAPWLIVHGESDETVPATEAETLQRAAAGVTEARLLAGADHTLGARHPFRGPTPPLIEAMNLTQAWLRRYLGAGGGPDPRS